MTRVGYLAPCGSGLARDSINAVQLSHPVACIASKPATTGQTEGCSKFLLNTPELIRPARPVTPLSHRCHTTLLC